MMKSLQITKVCLQQPFMAQGVKGVVKSAGLRPDMQLCSSQLQFIDRHSARRSLPVVSIGSEAARILNRGRAGRVLAVFNRSFYIQCDKQVFCVGLASLGRGPLHVLLESDWNQLPKELTSGLSISIGCQPPNCAGCHSVSRVNLNAKDNGILYCGKVSNSPIDPLVQQQFLRVFEILVPPDQQGFGWILGSVDWPGLKNLAEESPDALDALDASLRRQCLPALLCLSRWLDECLAGHNEPYSKTSDYDHPDYSTDTTDAVVMTVEMSSTLPALLGAGPGLTPAGDDLLAGVILALHRIDRTDLADAIWQLIEPLLSSRTNAISSAHLQQAAQGQCSEFMLQLLERVFNDSRHGQADDTVAIAADVQIQANGMGATSGWDILAGISLVLRAL